MENNVVVIVPTYNERDNIAKLIDEIDALRLPIDIFIVDDNSPDGTGEAVEAIKKTKVNVNIMHRNNKTGLGPAYIEAFRYVLGKAKYDYIIHMDADFSHNPKVIPRLLEAVKTCDVVIGSRYIKGGGVSGRWGFTRKFLSRFGNAYARLITGLKVNDCTGGFRCYRRAVLESIDFNKWFLNGYGFLIQMLYEVDADKFKICEVPIFFDEREKDFSKMNLHIILEAFFSLLVFRFSFMRR